MEHLAYGSAFLTLALSASLLRMVASYVAHEFYDRTAGRRVLARFAGGTPVYTIGETLLSVVAWVAHKASWVALICAALSIVLQVIAFAKR